MGVDQVHRAGVLKQTNKSHKTGRHRSKGAIDKEQKGKVNIGRENLFKLYESIKDVLIHFFFLFRESFIKGIKPKAKKCDE